MKKIQKLLAGAFALTLAFGATGCGNSGTGTPPGQNDGTKTTVKIIVYEGGIGFSWVKDAAERFSQLHEETSFEEGKTGVFFDIQETKTTNVDTMSTSAVDIYFDNNNSVPRDYSQKGWLADINDIVTEKIDTRNGTQVSIEDKINEDVRVLLKNRGDGHYYGLPYAEYYPGVSYDVEAFEANDFFFAAPDATSKIEYESDFGTAYFLKEENATSKKSCGVDGEYGTSDDGLPTSIQELLILCDRVREKGYAPFSYPGDHQNYANMFFQSLYASLAGKDKIRAGYDFTGSIDVVTGYSNENLFAGIDYIKKPTTKAVDVTVDNGYYTTQQAERYYALSVLEICQKEGWFSANSKDVTSNITCQGDFLNNGLTSKQKSAMLIEGSYWYNEAGDYGKIKQYQDLKKDPNAEKKVAWMPLPVSLNDTVTEGNGKEYTLLSLSNLYAFINKRTETNPGVLKAAKAFLQFTYTDDELSIYTGTHGVIRSGMNYEVKAEDKAKFSYFENSVFQIREKAEIVYQTSQNEMFLSNISSLGLQASMYVMPSYDGKFYSTLMSAIRAGATAQVLFENNHLDAADWNAYKK